MPLTFGYAAKIAVPGFAVSRMENPCTGTFLPPRPQRSPLALSSLWEAGEIVMLSVFGDESHDPEKVRIFVVAGLLG